jgi:hypothetical protein
MNHDAEPTALKKIVIRRKKTIDVKNTEKEEPLFLQQVLRKDILENMIRNTHLSGKEIFNIVMKENKEVNEERRQGWIFETLCQILIVLKCIIGTSYNEIYEGQLQNLKCITNINSLLKVKVEGGGNNIVDISLLQGTTLIPFSIKYKNKYSETDVCKIDNTINKQGITKDYKIGVIVKDKELITNHTYKNRLNIDKQIHDEIIKNGLLYDEEDIIKALEMFRQRFSNMSMNIDDCIEFINTEYLGSPRKLLQKRLHQRMTEMKFIQSLHTNDKNIWCIAHKPRSGKSITILLLCKYLLENEYSKILIMTSVPATINSFTNDIEEYMDFKNINYLLQDNFETIAEDFHGIVFCSVQYLKMDCKNKKRDLLKKIGFQTIIIDESHQGSSTDKTKKDILEVDNELEELRKNIRLNIFASGTSDKTKKYYGIHSSHIYQWEMEDEAYMKQLVNSTSQNKEEILQYMVNRHGNTFLDCFRDVSIENDYTKHPTQVLMKHSIPQILIDDIKNYNSKYGANYGYNCSSLFALQQKINENGVTEYIDEFELCKTADGKELLLGFFDSIISSNRMRNNTIMKYIEVTQSKYSSRVSSIENPLLFIIYLPTHTKNNTISLLQKTIKRFLEFHNLWSNYNIDYSNSIEDTGNVKEEYNVYIQSIMNKTRTEKKRGCILLLGNKGSVGITYKECDVTISLDDGHNLDNQKQRFSRALTEADGKTIGINVDMNIQRSYLYLIDIIQKYRKNTKTNKTNAEILYYLFTQNIFIFDPHQFNNGNIKNVEILSYYQREAENIIKEIDDTPFLENLVCNDDMRYFIHNDFRKIEMKIINRDLEGEQQECPKGDASNVNIDAPINNRDVGGDDENNKEEKAIVENLINQTYEMCKGFLFPLLGLISRSYKVLDFREIFTNENTKGLILSLLQDKKIEIKESDYIIIIMNNIITNNQDIVNSIREIYSIASPNKLRELIEKHFIPTQEEKQKNAEIPTPAKLVDEMLDKIPIEFWKQPQKVFEPCCGKGNFVLGIFDKFWNGLEELYPDNIERCIVIITECIYYGDITSLNVFITTELLKCHAQSYCGVDDFDCEFHSNVGNTLELDSKKKWGIEEFDAVIGNPPYQEADNNGKSKRGQKLYNRFIEYGFTRIVANGFILLITPFSWLSGSSNKQIEEDILHNIFLKYDLLYLNVNECKKYFNVGSSFTYYLIQNKITFNLITEVISEYKKQIEKSEINIKEYKNLSFLPIHITKETIDIVKKLSTNNNKIIVDRLRTLDTSTKNGKKHLRLEKDDVYKYITYHTDAKVYYSDIQQENYEKYKILLNSSGYLKPMLQNNCNVTEIKYIIYVASVEEGNKIIEVLNNEDSKKYFELCKYCGFNSKNVIENVTY